MGEIQNQTFKFATLVTNNTIMEQEITSGEKILNGFLRLTVILLVGILASVVIALILSIFGIL